MTPRLILVPLDGSAFAELALPHAAHVARGANAPLHLVTVLEDDVALMAAAAATTGIASGPALPVGIIGDLEPITRARRTALDRSAERVRTDHGCDVTTEVLTGGVVRALELYVETHGVDLVVMTTHGVGGLRRAWLGSVGDSLIRYLDVPILLVKADAVSEGTDPTFRSVLIALDGSPLAESIIGKVIGVIAADRPTLTLVDVTEPRTAIAMGSLAEPGGLVDRLDLGSEAEAYLEVQGERLRAAGWRVSVETKMHTSAARAIVKAAEHAQADLIAIATHGRGGLRRFLAGSVADKVIQHAETRVFVATARSDD